MNADLRAMLQRHEGLRLRPYLCQAGKTTIGYGRNLTDNGITLEEAEAMFEHDVNQAETKLRTMFPGMADWSQARQNALVDMLYNIGPARFAGFKKMIAAVRQGDWAKAAYEMRHSLWASQVPARAEELARMVEEGE